MANLTQIYSDVLFGEITPEDAKKQLHSSVEITEVFITPKHIERMLLKFLDKEIDAKMLSNWADFLVAEDAYTVRGWENDAIAERFEPMWNVLQMLSTPFIDGPINEKSVKAHLLDLAKM